MKWEIFLVMDKPHPLRLAKEPGESRRDGFRNLAQTVLTLASRSLTINCRDQMKHE